MKPIFDKEKILLEKCLEVKLPDNLWRDGSKIYINHNSKCVIEFKVEDGQCKLKKNLIKNIYENRILIEYKKGKKTTQEEIINYTYEEEYLQREAIIEKLEDESIRRSVQYIKEHPNYNLRIGDSSGKDSKLVKYILENKVFPKLNISKEDYVIEFFNTTNEIAQTYLNIKQDSKDNILEIHNPQIGWYQWIEKEKDYYLPSVTMRNCCDTYKHGRVKEVLDKNQSYITFLGMRKYESTKRSEYDWDLNQYMKSIGKLDVPENWKRFLPIVEWKDEDVWLYVFHNKLNINEAYKYGLNRIGCLICPYQSDFSDLVIKEYFPMQYNRWLMMVDKNYELWNIGKRLKWTKEEWRLGKWKTGVSKEYELITKKPTKERVELLATIKGISEELALKYFKRKCRCCNKNLNPDEVAMNLKLFGRYENVEDNREFMCQKCLNRKMNWTKKDYQERVIEFRSQNCNLF